VTPSRLFPLLGILLALGLGGCLVTEKKLSEEFSRREKNAKKRNLTKLDAIRGQMEVLQGKVEAQSRIIKALEINITVLKTDLLAVKGNIGRVFEASKKVKTVRLEAEKALKSTQELKGELEVFGAAMATRNEKILSKYRALLLEEKRLLAERIRFLNTALRALEKKEEKGGK